MPEGAASLAEPLWHAYSPEVPALRDRTDVPAVTIQFNSLLPLNRAPAAGMADTQANLVKQ